MDPGSTASSPSATISSLPTPPTTPSAAFAELRAKHVEPAKNAFDEARQRSSKASRTRDIRSTSEIVQSYYASPLYRTVKRWLEERK